MHSDSTQTNRSRHCRYRAVTQPAERTWHKHCLLILCSMHSNKYNHHLAIRLEPTRHLATALLATFSALPVRCRIRLAAHRLRVPYLLAVGFDGLYAEVQLGKLLAVREVYYKSKQQQFTKSKEARHCASRIPLTTSGDNFARTVSGKSVVSTIPMIYSCRRTM